MRYLIALIIPPLAVLLCGKPFQAVLNVFLTLAFYVPGVVHAVLVVSARKADERQAALVAQLGGNAKAAHAMRRQNGAAIVLALLWFALAAAAFSQRAAIASYVTSIFSAASHRSPTR